MFEGQLREAAATFHTSTEKQSPKAAPAKHQPIWMFVGSELADGLAVKGAEVHQHFEWTVQKIVGVRKSARTVQRRVAADQQL